MTQLLRVLISFPWLAAAIAAAAPMGYDEARLLLVRTSYAASEREVARFARLDRAQAVERLLAGAVTGARMPPPTWVDERIVPQRELRAMSQEQRKAEFATMFRRGVELREWWLGEMLATPWPLTEKMTLFWHNHFVSSQQKVRHPQLMYRQNVLLRRHALGNFGELLHAIARDPAMVIYLDSASNRKGQPNENFAREVMELFTLGEGRYTERDIKEAARAFTGWSIDPGTGEFVFRRAWHDEGVKTVLGVTGNLDGDAVLDILLARSETAEFIVAKLWREFVSPQPDPAEVRRIARVFREARYDVKAALGALLTSDAFCAEQNRGTLVKSPVDLIVGTLRQFNFTTGELTPFAFAAIRLGQNLFAPPNVKGWPGGEAWINSTTLLARKALLERLFRGEEMRLMPAAMTGERMQGAGRLGPDARERLARAMAEVRFDAGRWFAQFTSKDAAAVVRLLLPVAPVNPPAAGASGLELIRQVTQDPAYQLK